MMISRKVAPLLLKGKKSALLLGPRQTGKSTLIRGMNPEMTINLAEEQVFLDFSRNPSELQQRLKAAKPATVFIDEVQRLPSLLNTLQTILDDPHNRCRFLLTGSSARKLRRGHANLLPGRIHTYHLGPLVSAELSYELDTQQALETGTLPQIYTSDSSDERTKTLRSYSGTYLKEEIQAEALTRNLEGFSRFLFVAAACSGQSLDLAKLSSEAAIPRQSAVRYFEILEDTLILQPCPPFSKSDRKRLVQHPKYYFFDTGVLNALLGNFHASPDRKGALFEHLFFNQLVASAYAADEELRISSYRTEHGAEVDLIVEMKREVWAIELKASRDIGKNDLRGLNNFREFYGKNHHSVVGYLGDVEKGMEQVLILPWQKLLKQMGL